MTDIQAVARQAARQHIETVVSVIAPAGKAMIDEMADAVAVAVLEAVKALRCRAATGAPHYCPNCDNTLDGILEPLLSALSVRPGGDV